MNREQIESRVRQLVAKHLGVDPAEVTSTASFVDVLGADSLDSVELVMAIEEEFELEIPDQDGEQITNLQQAVDYVAARARG